MNIWEILFLCFAFQSFSLSILFGFRRNSLKIANFIWAIFLFLFSLNIVYNVLFWSFINPLLTVKLSLWYVLPFSLYGPLFYLYIQTLTTEKKITLKAVSHAIPALLVFINYGLFYIQPTESKLQIIRANAISEYTILPTYYFERVLVIVILGYAYFSYKNFVSTFNGDPEMKLWLKSTTIIFAGFGISWLIYYILSEYEFFNNEHDYIITFMMVLFIAFTSYFGFNYSSVFNGKELTKVFPLAKYKKSGLTHQELIRLKDEVFELVKNEKLYLDSELKLINLSQKLNTSRHHISQVLNDCYKMNFFEFINQFRIEEAKVLLRSESSSTLSIKEILYKSGFNNKVSFYNAFKKQVGITPSEYRSKAEIVS